MNRGIRSAIRDGRGTYFWLTRWIDSGERLIDLLDGDPNLINQDDTVADLVGENGQWDWDKLSPHLPSDVLDKVAGMSPPKSEASDDDWIWGLKGNGRFSIRSAYNLIRNTQQEQDTLLWRRVWGWKDGAVNPLSGKAASGGLIRDEEGRLLKAFTANIGVCSITRAEIRGVLTGLRLAWEAGYKKVLVHMDSRAAIALLQDPNHVTHHHAIEVLQFRDLLTKDWTVEIRHIYRE
ncbi:Putative ribonuclease H protein At1g65750, partial [Linum perenne]